MLWRRILFVLVLASTMVAGALAQTFNGNLLPGQNDGTGGANVLPKTRQQIQNTASPTPSRTVREYVGNAGKNGGPLKKTAVLECQGIGKIGDLVFEYGAWTGETTGDTQNTRGGMIIRGGLKLAPLIQVKPGHTLQWLQVYKETGGTATTTVDSDPSDPLYPDHTLTGFTPLFFDAPSDQFENPDTPDAIDFETALVCFKNDDPKNLKSLGVFQWGYKIDKSNKTITNEYLLLGNFPTPLTALLSNTFNAEFGANGTRDKGWTLLAGGCPDCFVVVPEPATLTLFALGAMPLWRALRRQRPRTPSLG